MPAYGEVKKKIILKFQVDAANSNGRFGNLCLSLPTKKWFCVKLVQHDAQRMTSVVEPLKWSVQTIS